MLLCGFFATQTAVMTQGQPCNMVSNFGLFRLFTIHNRGITGYFLQHQYPDFFLDHCERSQYNLHHRTVTTQHSATIERKRDAVQVQYNTIHPHHRLAVLHVIIAPILLCRLFFDPWPTHFQIPHPFLSFFLSFYFFCFILNLID